MVILQEFEEMLTAIKRASKRPATTPDVMST